MKWEEKGGKSVLFFFTPKKKEKFNRPISFISLLRRGSLKKKEGTHFLAISRRGKIYISARKKEGIPYQKTRNERKEGGTPDIPVRTDHLSLKGETRRSDHGKRK